MALSPEQKRLISEMIPRDEMNLQSRSGFQQEALFSAIELFSAKPVGKTAVGCEIEDGGRRVIFEAKDTPTVPIDPHRSAVNTPFTP